MRKLCLESGRATGLSSAPKRKVRCLVCDRLVRIVPIGEHLVVSRHYIELRKSLYGGKFFSEGTF